MSKPILYGVDTSGPTRFCLLTASAIGLEVDLRAVDFTKNEHRTPEFKKINPIQTTPVLEDNGTYITDSHAICTYLVQKYGSAKHQELYPADLVERTMVDQKMFFDTGVLFVRLCKVLVSFQFLLCFVVYENIPAERGLQSNHKDTRGIVG